MARSAYANWDRPTSGFHLGSVVVPMNNFDVVFEHCPPVPRIFVAAGAGESASMQGRVMGWYQVIKMGTGLP